jgi:hypothetical protein
MSLALRRFVVLQAFLIWQGGFFFYATVVVPTGTVVLESAKLQGAITQGTTNWLNAFGVASLVLLAWDQLASPIRCRKRWLSWSLMAIALGVQISLHPVLDRMFDAETGSYTDRPTFKYWHGIYLWATAVHWLAGLAALWFMLCAWHAESRSRP